MRLRIILNYQNTQAHPVLVSNCFKKAGISEAFFYQTVDEVIEIEDLEEIPLEISTVSSAASSQNEDSDEESSDLDLRPAPNIEAIRQKRRDEGEMMMINLLSKPVQPDMDLQEALRQESRRMRIESNSEGENQSKDINSDEDYSYESRNDGKKRFGGYSTVDEFILANLRESIRLKLKETFLDNFNPDDSD